VPAPIRGASPNVASWLAGITNIAIVERRGSRGPKPLLSRLTKEDAMFHAIRKHLIEQLRIHRDIVRLQRLDDHLLADVGVPRDHIASYVRGECR
jgi:uncharacterized protein YjiS (DUF1127 family)